MGSHCSINVIGIFLFRIYLLALYDQCSLYMVMSVVCSDQHFSPCVTAAISACPHVHVFIGYFYELEAIGNKPYNSLAIYVYRIEITCSHTMAYCPDCMFIFFYLFVSS